MFSILVIICYDANYLFYTMLLQSELRDIVTSIIFLFTISGTIKLFRLQLEDDDIRSFYVLF